METLNAHNPFDTISAHTHYQMGLEFPREPTSISAWNRSLNKKEKTIQKAQEAPEASVECRIEERRTCEDHPSGQIKDLSSSNTELVQLSNQPLKSNNPTIDLENVLAASSAVKADELTEREYFMRCVVIGSINAGKHSLIANLSEEHKKLEIRTGVNLVMKTSMHLKTTKKYHFWMRTVGETCETKDAIWKTYYKWATAFVFVYDLTNRESFEALENAVKSVLEIVPQNKFFGILVGNKNDLSKQRAVEYNEAVNFKQKYNLNDFIETNSSIEKQASQIMPRLDTKLKLTFESI
jgi:small GTP-binding protein